jgi:hypothetical protein
LPDFLRILQEAPYGDYAKLQMAMNYHALDIRSGRVLGGDNLDLN